MKNLKIYNLQTNKVEKLNNNYPPIKNKIIIIIDPRKMGEREERNGWDKRKHKIVGLKPNTSVITTNLNRTNFPI